MDPFRDELGAAHAKIAALEATNQALRNALDARYPPTPPKEVAANGKVVSLGALIAIIGLCALGGGLLAAYSVRGARAAASSDYRGIATADPPQNAAVPAVVNPGVTATSTKSSASKQCNCAPGDPLCSCL